MDEQEDNDSSEQPKHLKKGNVLPLWGNERTMNMNPLILTNIQSSHYFKVNLYELKTYHEVIDEIYYKVNHLEPWEKGSRKTAGQTGMCGGVRGVGAGGIVSTAYCLLYKLFTLRLTRKQLNGLINHADSPYIRALGFMYIRYSQPPADLYDWYDEYLEDPEEMDVKAGGGQVLTVGDMLRAFLTKLEWFSTLFPRIPVPIQQKIEKRMNERFPPQPVVRQVIQPQRPMREARNVPEPEPEKYARTQPRGNERERWNGGKERAAWNEKGGSGGHRERSPMRNREDGRRERYEPQRDRDQPPRDRYEPQRDRDQPQRDRDQPQRDRYEPQRDRDQAPRERYEPQRERDQPQRDREQQRDRSSHRDRGRDREHRHRDDRVRSHHQHR